MASKQRTHRMEKLARIYDDEILPIWSQKFGRLLLRDLKLPDKGQILDVAAGTGYPTTELIRLKSDDTRLIAIESSSAMLDVARRKLEESGAKGVFLRSESPEPKLKFADGVYDLVVCNLSLWEMKDPRRALADFARVTRLGGEVRATLPLAGSFAEFFDIYREVLVKQDKHETAVRLKQHIDERYPSVETCESWMAKAGLESATVDVEEFTLLFRSSREFFFAPVIEYGPLAEWKAVAGAGQEMQDVFWYIKEGIDSYFEGRAFEVTIRVGCLRGLKGESLPDLDESIDISTEESVDASSDESIDFSADREPATDTDEPIDEPDSAPQPRSEESIDIDIDTEGFASTTESLPLVTPDEDEDDLDETRPVVTQDE